MGVHPSEIITGYVMAHRKALEILPCMYIIPPLVRMGVHPSEIITGYVMAHRKALEILPCIYITPLWFV